jgi:ABC-type Fe3+-hydroxamate transport system substrate-binding protein
VLDPLSSLEGLLSLGVAPAQIGQRSFVKDYNGGDPLKQWPWLEDALTNLGANPERINADTTNIEAVAAFKPDFIIGQEFWVKEQRPLLEEIAPTLMTPLADVRKTITMLGEVMGMEAQAAKVIADWDERIKTELENSVPDGKTIAIIRTDGEGTFTVFNTPGYGPYDIFTRMGFGVPNALASAEKNQYGLGSDLSLEALNVLDPADVIVVLGFSVDATDALLVNPLFTRIPAVKAGRVLRIAQGPIAQGLAIQSPLNFDTLLAEVKKAADFVQ